MTNLGGRYTALTSIGPSSILKLRINPVGTTRYDLQENLQIKRYNRTIISGRRHYVAEHQKNCDTFLFPLTCTCNVRVRRATKLPPFSLATTRLQLGPTAITRPMPSDVSEIDLQLAYRLYLIYRAALPRSMANKNSKRAPER